MESKSSTLFRTNRGLYFALMLVFCFGALVFEEYLLFVLELAGTALAFGVHLYHQRSRDSGVRRYLQQAGETMESTSGGTSPLPSVLIRLGDNEILWCNTKFGELTDLTPTTMEQPLANVLPGIRLDWLLSGKTECPEELSRGDRRYRVYGTRLREKNGPPQRAVLYLADLTELYQVRDEYIRSRPIVAILMVDNYAELTKNLTESAISSLDARINEAITVWADGYHGLLRKLDKNRFLFIFERRDLNRAVEDKFSLLEEVNKIHSSSGVAASLSVGVGADGSCFEESYDFAALGTEMALSRGGNQAVIKNRQEFTFFGGRSEEADYTSRVRSRTTANSLMELIGQSSRVFVMGHRNADLDCIGAAMGIGCLCRKADRPMHIVIDLEHNASERLIDEIRQVPEYADVFMSPQDALISCDNRSTLVIVDTNRPDQVESRALLDAIPRVCVVDHHRRAADYIDNAVVSFHETYASSASELVLELLLYGTDTGDVLPIEAKSLLAGICLDTKFFNVRTGERTFDAAAALRRMGADTTEVKRLLQNDFDNTLARYDIIRSAQRYPGHEDIAIAVPDHGVTRVLAAQAADEMLNIYGIQASFVMYQEEDQVVISARSMGQVNVQVILEQLGGGGNAAVAGAQLKGETTEAVKEKLNAAIDTYLNT